MRKPFLFLLCCMLLSCSSDIAEFDPPITGKEIGERWEEIRENAVPCDFPGCGSANYNLFRVKYPSFSLLFTGSRVDGYDRFESFFNVYREMNGSITDYRLFVLLGEEGYLMETEFFHVTENIEIPEGDQYIGISDTGLVIPSRQP